MDEDIIKNESFWNFIFSVLFIGLFAWMAWYLWSINRLPLAINVFDFTLIILASFRVTRLFVYDKVTQFIRYWLLDEIVLDEVMGENEKEVYYMRKIPVYGPRRVMFQLISCPWCFGIWASLWVSFLYFATPFAWFLILVLAVAGIATLLQLIANAVGWTAEEKKLKVELKTDMLDEYEK
jgi:hypothetical protein